MRALQAWIKAADLRDGPPFRPIDRHGNVRPKRLNGSDVAVIVKRCVAAAGFDPDLYSGHSLLRAWPSPTAAEQERINDLLRRCAGAAAEAAISAACLYRAPSVAASRAATSWR